MILNALCICTGLCVASSVCLFILKVLGGLGGFGWFEYFGGKVKCHWKNRCKTRPARLVKIFIEEGERTYFYERLVWSRKSRWFGWCAK